jgi:hypothetical protein
MLLIRVALVIAVSLAALLISLALDRMFASLSAIPQFLIQIPTLVLIMDYLRARVIDHVEEAHGLTVDDVNGAFFFAAPLAAVASADLMAEIRRLLI